MEWGDAETARSLGVRSGVHILQLTGVRVSVAQQPGSHLVPEAVRADFDAAPLDEES